MFPELPDANIEIRNPIASPSAPAHQRRPVRAGASRAKSLTAPNFPHHRIASNTKSTKKQRKCGNRHASAFSANSAVNFLC
jgi:hypothetical protein